MPSPRLVTLLPETIDTARFEQLGAILHNAWPESGSSCKRTEQLSQIAKKAVSGHLPLSYSFEIEENGHITVFGHAKLQDTADVSAGKAVAVTSVVVDSRERGRGFGKSLMEALECEARSLGYGMLYLWTDTAAEFYRKCGYNNCDQVSLSLPVFKSFGGKAEGVLDSLESALSKKLAFLQKGPPSTQSEPTVAREDAPPPTSGEAAAKYVWMRKRLVDFSSSMPLLSWEATMDALASQVIDGCWTGGIRRMKWQQQVGPTCGLTALRMVHECVTGIEPRASSDPTNRLLQHAIEMGVTSEGEMFNLDALKEIAQDFLGLNVLTLCFTKPIDTQINQIVDSLCTGSLIVFPYDRQAGSFLPDFVEGTAAHYCIIVGFLIRKRNQTCKDVPWVSKVSELGAATEKLQQEDTDDVRNINDVYFVVQHSGQNKFVVAPAMQFIESNLQLVTHKQSSDNRWVTDGMDLNGKCLIVSSSSVTE